MLVAEDHSYCSRHPGTDQFAHQSIQDLREMAPQPHEKTYVRDDRILLVLLVAGRRAGNMTCMRDTVAVVTAAE